MQRNVRTRRVAADGVERDVDTAAVGLAEHDLGEVLGPVVDDELDAPSSWQHAVLRSPPATAITRAPACTPSWIAAEPAPPAPACTSMVSPACSRARSCTASHARWNGM